MLDNLNYEDYAAQINTDFQLPEVGIELKLVELIQKINTSEQEAFSLIFCGSKNNYLEQKIYSLNHEKLGGGGLFLVPVGLDADGYKYEAGFNRFIGKI